MRPTTDKVRSAVFSIISDYVKHASILDLFAGTGSIGIEGISRGASSCTFVDLDTRLLRENLSMLDLATYKVKRGDCYKILGRLEGSFDIIFADPPYEIYSPEKLLNAVFINKILANDGILIYEESVRTRFNIASSMFEELDSRTYGETSIRILRQRI